MTTHYWLRGNLIYLTFLWLSLLVVQLTLSALTMFILSLEMSGGAAISDVVPEEERFDLLAGFVAGWSVLVFELAAAVLRDAAGLAAFARRPLSPVDLWWNLQRNGLHATPLQLLFSLPFLILPAVFSPELGQVSLISLALAFVTCIGVRTAICAFACYLAALATLRAWISTPFHLLAVAGSFALIVLCVGRPDDVTLTALTRQLLLLPAAFVFLAVTWGVWHGVSRPGRFLRRCW